VETQQPTPPASSEQATNLPDLATLTFTAPDDVVFADDPRAAALAEWIAYARDAGHVIAEHLSPGDPTANTTGSRHCGTARIGAEAFDIYLGDSANHVYPVRVTGVNARALLGLDQAPAASTSRTAGRDFVVVGHRYHEGEDEQTFVGILRGTVEGQATSTADPLSWTAQTTQRLTELVRQARLVQGSDDQVQDLADALAVIAALLPRWDLRDVDPTTEHRINRVTAALGDLVVDLGA